jgi:hypothetical protein
LPSLLLTDRIGREVLEIAAWPKRLQEDVEVRFHPSWSGSSQGSRQTSVEGSFLRYVDNQGEQVESKAGFRTDPRYGRRRSPGRRAESPHPQGTGEEQVFVPGRPDGLLTINPHRRE